MFKLLWALVLAWFKAKLARLKHAQDIIAEHEKIVTAKPDVTVQETTHHNATGKNADSPLK